MKNPSSISRRDFLGSTAVIGGSLIANLEIARVAHAAGSDTLRVALIGCGGRGSGAADQALNTHTVGPIKLVAMADAFRDQLDNSYKNLKEKHGDRVDVPDDHKFTGFDAYKQAMALADMVILATPPGFRPIHFEEAVKQGKHVFMEKPVATDAPGVRRVLAAAVEAKKKNLKVAVGLQRHHQPNYIATIQKLNEGAIGDIVSMRCYWNGNGVWVRSRKPDQTEMQYQMRNWYYFNWLCGDHINEQHIHNLDVINWIKGTHPVKAQGMGGRQVRTGIDHGEIYDHHFVEFVYPDGSHLLSQCRHIGGCWDSVSEHVRGTKGTCDVSGFRITGETPWRYQSKPEDNDGWQLEHYPLHEAIRDDKPYNEAEYGAMSTMTAIMGRMCTYSGKEITWDQAFNSKLNLLPDEFSWDAKPKSLPDKDGRYAIAVPGDRDWLPRIL